METAVLALYGGHAAREEAVEDLIKRRNRAAAKLEATAQPRSGHATLTVPVPSAGVSADPHAGTELEVLTCQQCNGRFERMRVRGRKPALCLLCRAAASP